MSDATRCLRIATAAKVNLTLEMLRRRPDGYHDLASVFCAIELWDELTFTPSPDLRLSVQGAHLPCDERNLCWRAATGLAALAGVRPAVSIAVRKQIPVGGGLGGGSGNAAGTLAALRQFWRLAVPAAELARLAAELGSDVPFFLHGGTALAAGRGEQLTPLPALTGYRVVVLAPAAGVSTGAVYGALRDFRPAAGAASATLATALRAGAVPAPETWLVNDLEAPAAAISPTVAADRAVLQQLDLPPWRLSGSGGSWFVLASPAQAAAVVATLRAAFADRAVWDTSPATVGWRVLESNGV
ncbi:MAG: 4-(cytidine 5'-diphospho)-2-C-methyl-D-erythritol kinase [Fimbriimonadaceae bacterium]|nr:4-(cytidine 5'-diphospho)-2-C-methyl-D-erythritol kinase [Fimbriimonadaceae bacterium]